MSKRTRERDEGTGYNDSVRDIARVKVTGITVSVRGTEYAGASRGGRRVNEVHKGDS